MDRALSFSLPRHHPDCNKKKIKQRKVYPFFLSFSNYKTKSKMSTDTELENHLAHDSIDLELKDLNIDATLRANKSFMRLAAAMFHYGNPSLCAGQLVNCVRSLALLPLR